MEKITKKPGFTLIEIITVLVIIMLLAAVALPQYANVIERSRARKAQEILLEIYGAQKRFFLDNDIYASSEGQLDISIRDLDYFNDPVILDNSGGYLATIARDHTQKAYTLRINDNHTITCNGTSPADICSRLGF